MMENYSILTNLARTKREQCCKSFGIIAEDAIWEENTNLSLFEIVLMFPPAFVSK